MSLKFLRYFGRTLTFRLNLWYASIFTASAAVLFVLVYVLLAAAIGRKDAEVIDSRIKEYALIYESGGIPALRSWLGSSHESREPLLVRLVTRKGHEMIVLRVPPDWVGTGPQELDPDTHQGDVPLRIPKDAEHDLVFAKATLFDGSVLQVGRVTNSRRILLQPFRRIFFVVITPVI